MTKYRKPIDALVQAADMAILSSRPLRPGVVIEHLPEETRRLLRELTSDEARTVRVEWMRRLARRSPTRTTR